MKTTKTILVTLMLALFGLSNAYSQVGIGTTTPNASAALDIESTTKGFLPPRMSKGERDLIGSPEEGLTIYNIDDNCLNVYVGLGWRNLCAVVGPTDVVNPQTGRIWMDRNLGANRVATAISDAAAYGDLYQWGRATEGHEKVFRVTGDDPTSNMTTTQATTPLPGTGGNAWDGLFINVAPNWLNTDNVTLWQGVNGTNNPCPTGYRVPTRAEFSNEISTWASFDNAGAINSTLKMVPGWMS